MQLTTPPVGIRNGLRRHRWRLKLLAAAIVFAGPACGVTSSNRGEATKATDDTTASGSDSTRAETETAPTTGVTPSPSASSSGRSSTSGPAAQPSDDKVEDNPATETGNDKADNPAPGPTIQADGFFRWIELDHQGTKLVWRGDDDQPLGQLELARLQLEDRGETVVAMANAGIYRESLAPLGLHIEDGRELVGLNQQSGAGNFYLEPNGVLAITESGFHLLATAQFADRYRSAPQPTLRSGDGGDEPVVHATQSGPLLVQNGEINPLFTPNSESRTIRTAVGVGPEGQAILLMAWLPVNMWELANRATELGLSELLYLDGSVARLDPVVEGRPVFPNIPLAAMIAVVAVTDETGADETGTDETDLN